MTENRREHFNEVAKGQHIGSDHFANGKHGYSPVVAGAIPMDKNLLLSLLIKALFANIILYSI